MGFVLFGIIIIISILYILFYAIFKVNKRRISNDLRPFKYAQNEEIINRRLELTKKEMKRECEHVYVKSFDELKLHGSFYKVENSNVFEIMFHGYKSTGLRAFAGILSDELNSKRNVLIVDERAHGLSSGRFTTLGTNERYDVISWIDYILDNYGIDSKIIIRGTSMGGYTVLLSSELDLKDNVKAIISDAAYTDIKSMMKFLCDSKKVPFNLIYPLVNFDATVFGKIDLNETSAIKAVSNTNIPIIFTHGTGDNVVALESVNKLYDACNSKKKVYITEEAAHSCSYYTNQKVYEKTINDFLYEIDPSL